MDEMVHHVPINYKEFIAFEFDIAECVGWWTLLPIYDSFNMQVISAFKCLLTFQNGFGHLVIVWFIGVWTVSIMHLLVA